jgi:predicted oxidoreductase
MKANSLIVGVMTWGIWGKMLTDAQMAQQIEQTLALGLNRFDHADIYGDYTTEAQFGAALKQSGVDREKLQLITKCGIQMTKGRNNNVKHYQYDASYIVWSAEQSLRNLQTDYIDVFLLHRPSPLMHGEEIGTAVAQLLERGLIKSFGLSNFLPHQVDYISAFAPVEVNQVQCSITHTDPMYDGTFEQTRKMNIEPMAWSPLGSLFKEPESESALRVASVAKGLTLKYDTDLAGLAMAFLANHPARISPVVGTTSMHRLSHLKNAFEIVLDLQDWFVLLEAVKGTRVP